MAQKKVYKILIIDDDKFLLDVYSVKFREFGHAIITSFGAEEALEIVKKSDDFDAVILDIVMPGMDGFEFISKLKSKNLAKDSAIIVLTNQGETKDIERAKELEVDGYIVKATTIPSDVLKEVLKIIDDHQK